MKTRLGYSAKLAAMVFLAILIIYGCKKKDETPVDTLKGNPGNPRFNLQFTNHLEVDLDLYVRTPNGLTIYYLETELDGGKLDVDCKCSNCPNGPNENIYWTPGTAPSGTYTFWVHYYGGCSTNGAASTFTLRRLKNEVIEETLTGTLTSGTSSNYTFVY